MSKTNPTEKESKSLRAKIIDSHLAGWIANLPPIAWTTRTLTRTFLRQKIRPDHTGQENIIVRGAETGLDATLEDIVRDVVEALGYLGAMVATYEQGDALPVRAFYIDSTVASKEQIRQWEDAISNVKGTRVSITNPKIAVAYVYQDEYKNNLSVRAVKAGKPIISNHLHDLFRPVAPSSSMPVVQGIQEALGIHQVIAVPFFLEITCSGDTKREVVGNLFAAKRDQIGSEDLLTLSAFGRQAAAAIESERRRLQAQVIQDLILSVQANLQDVDRILHLIAEGVVTKLGYVGAMVATYEPGDALPVRAFYIDPTIASKERVWQWEAEISTVKGEQVSLTDPEIAVAYRYQDEFRDNLSVRAIEASEPITSNHLYDLFTPVAPVASKPIVQGIQEALDIHQVIAVPFFIYPISSSLTTEPEVVGNLFAVTRSRSFFQGEIELLETFGQQAAIGIQNAQLYKVAKDRQAVAEVFAKMAFSSAAYVHALRNHIGAFRMFSQMINSQLSNESFRELNEGVLERLQQAADILDNLHEPWRQQPDSQTDVNLCLSRAINKTIPDPEVLQETEGIVVTITLTEGLPSSKTSPDMLTEAFRVLIKNALEAIREKIHNNNEETTGNLWIASCSANATTVEVVIRDDGVGIKPEDLSKVFEMHWSTKDTGMGFGLFWTKDYIEGLGGSIGVESNEQEGTSFRIHLLTSNES